MSADKALIPDNETANINVWLVSFAVMLAPFMEILDTSVANVALPHMSGTFSATPQEIIWVVTSYLVANGIVIPSTAWFSSFLGRKKFLLICIVIFTAASALCGASNSLEMLVFARIVQGAGGGALQPISQAVLLESFPPSKRGMGMAIFGLGIILAPILGPVLGGWITDNYSWQWIFYINVPIGILAIILIQMFVRDPSYAKKSIPKKIDYVGFLALVIWLATLQIILDKGQQYDWFDSNIICGLAYVSLGAMVFFLIWELYFKDSIIDLKVYLDRNFAMGSLLILVLGAILFGTLAILPMFLQNLMGYPAVDSGLAIAPRGIGSFVAMAFAGALSGRIDNRIQMIFGVSCLAISNFWLGNINFQIAPQDIIIPNILMGVGLAFVFIPLMAAAFSTLKNEQITNATGLFNLMRNIGGGIGTSIIATMLTRNAQKHQVYMVEHFGPTATLFQEKLSAVKQVLAMNMDMVSATTKANFLLYQSMIKQANLCAYADNFKVFGIICLALLPAILLFKNTNVNKKSKDIIVH